MIKKDIEKDKHFDIFSKVEEGKINEDPVRIRKRTIFLETIM